MTAKATTAHQTTYQATYIGRGEFYTGLRTGDQVTVERIDLGYAVSFVAYRVVDLGQRQVTLAIHDAPSMLAPLTPADAVRALGYEPEPDATGPELAAILADLS